MLMLPSHVQGAVGSFIEVLHEAPRLADLVPPAALKALSATCKTLRTCFCAQVTVITLCIQALLLNLATAENGGVSVLIRPEKQSFKPMGIHDAIAHTGDGCCADQVPSAASYAVG